MQGFRKHEVRECFFDVWSHEMSYVLGFISADGSVDKYTLSVELNKKDVEVVKFIRDCLSPEKQIEEIEKKGSVRIKVNSVVLLKSLSNFGIVPNKSRRIKLDFNIPGMFVGDFVRGLFDGDGWVCVRRNTLECGFASASEGYLENVRDVCGGIGRDIRVRYGNDSRRNLMYMWEFSKGDALKLRDLMYGKTDVCFALERKKSVFFSEFYVRSERFWSDEQIKYLIDNFEPNVIGCLERMAFKIGKSYKSVSVKVCRLGLTSKSLG